MDTLLIKAVSPGRIGFVIADYRLQFRRQGYVSRIIKNRLHRCIDTAMGS